MDKLMLSLDTGKTDVFLRKCITTESGEKIYVKNISVLWKYKNVRSVMKHVFISVLMFIVSLKFM